MKKLVFLAVVLVAVAGVATADAADVSFRAGGGYLFDAESLGGGIAADIGISEYPIAIAPFFEYYSNDPSTLMTFGADILYKAPIADDKANIYVGAGAGAAVADVDGSTLDSATGLLIDVRGGLDYGITDVIGIYGEAKYVWSDKDPSTTKLGIDLSDFGIMVGISFKLGGM